MSFKQTVDVTQIAVFIDPVKTKALGAAVWSALDEVATFFATASPDGEFAVPIHDAPPDTIATITFESRRVLVAAPDVEPPAEPDHVLPDEFLAELVDRQQRQRGQTYESLVGSTQPEGSASSYGSSSSSSLATPARPRIDARLLGPKMQSLVKPHGWSLVVTDIELTPPPEWRYIIWDQFPLGAAASVAPLDPEYWREPYDSEQARIVIAKRRIRAACVSIVGALIGLHRCQNEACFLYGNVDSVIRLDEMEIIGPEHGVAELTNRGFSATDDLLQASATSASAKAGPKS